MLGAINRGMNIVNGLHQFLNDDSEFAAASVANGVTIHDVRKPRDKKDLKVFSGRIHEVTCPRIAVLGTDGAIGKRTTSTLLAKALNERGIKAVMVGTGQTSLIQGAKYGIANDHYGDILWQLDRKIQARYFWQAVLNLDETEDTMKETIKNKLIEGLKNS